MLTSLVCFTFAYCSMLRVLLPAACGRRLLVRLRRALLALSDVPAAAAIGCMNITGDATFGDRSELTRLRIRTRCRNSSAGAACSAATPIDAAASGRLAGRCRAPGMTVEILGFSSLSPHFPHTFFGSFRICSRLTS